MTALAQRVSPASFVRRATSLPTLPAVALRVASLIEDPRTDATRVARVIGSDPSLTATLLRLVNSPYYAVPGGVSDVRRAAAFLGFHTLAQLALAVCVLDGLPRLRAKDVDPTEFWLHSIHVGCLARVVAERARPALAAEAFTAGLLHDIAIVVLAQQSPDVLAEAVAVARARQTGLSEELRKRGMPAPHELGLELARRWKLPPSLQSACAVDVEGEPTRGMSGLPLVLWLGHRLAVRQGRWDFEGAGETKDLPAQTLAHLGLVADDEGRICASAEPLVEQSRALLNLVV